MSPFNYFKQCMTQKYADFSGRARRSEYWYFVLFGILTYIVAGLADMLFVKLIGFPILIWVAMLAMLVPSIAVVVRRLHDTSRSGWWMLLSLVPIASIVVLVFMFLDSTPGTNEYGPNPKGIGSDQPADHLITDEV